LFDGKVNIVGTLGGQNLKFLVIFKSAEKNQKKIKEYHEFLRKIDFGFWCNSKTNDRLYMKFSLVVYISIFYT